MYIPGGGFAKSRQDFRYSDSDCVSIRFLYNGKIEEASLEEECSPEEEEGSVRRPVEDEGVGCFLERNAAEECSPDEEECSSEEEEEGVGCFLEQSIENPL
jgi:hypothetical protein